MKTLVFENAPLIEVAIGAQFNLPVINEPLIYKVWEEQLNRDYPKTEIHPYLFPVVETENAIFSSEIKIPSRSNRKFFISESGHKLVQLQDNRILFNWRTSSGKEDYPHFNNVLAEFLRVFKILSKHLPNDSIINQLEISYFDHIMIDQFGVDYYNVDEIFKWFNISKNLRTVNVEFTTWNPDLLGNLIIKMQSAMLQSLNKKVITLDSVFRGVNKANQSIEEWFVIAHDFLLNNFEESLTEKAKSVWKIQQ